MTEEEKSTYPKGPIREVGRIDYLLAAYPNMYADLSAMSAMNALSRDAALAKSFLQKHHRKLLFGTDRFVREEEPLIIDFLQGVQLPSEMEDRILHKNAEVLLGLRQSAS